MPLRENEKDRNRMDSIIRKERLYKGTVTNYSAFLYARPLLLSLTTRLNQFVPPSHPSFTFIHESSHVDFLAAYSPSP